MTAESLAELWRLLDAANAERVMSASLEMDYSLMRKSTRALFVAAVDALPALLDAAAERDALAAEVDAAEVDAAEARLAAVRDIVRDVATDAGDDRGTYGETYHAGMVTVAARIRQALAIDAPTIDGRADA